MGDFVYFLVGGALFALMMAYAVRSNRIEAKHRKDQHSGQAAAAESWRHHSS
jgi:uncharacterized membrane protein